MKNYNIRKILDWQNANLIIGMANAHLPRETKSCLMLKLFILGISNLGFLLALVGSCYILNSLQWIIWASMVFEVKTNKNFMENYGKQEQSDFLTWTNSFDDIFYNTFDNIRFWVCLFCQAEMEFTYFPQ